MSGSLSGLMEGKRVLISGVRNRWSIAWHTALSLHAAGAELAFSVLGDREESGLKKLLQDVDFTGPIFHCDATNAEQVEKLMASVGEHFGGTLDGFLHGIAFAKKEELSGAYVDTSHDGFTVAHESSVYSLVNMARYATPLLAPVGGSIVTLSYLGAERVVPNYNVMGVAKAALEASVRYLASDLGPQNIRVNAVSAGPIRTLAASAIGDFDSMVKMVAERSPLRRSVDAGEVGDTVLFLMSRLARGITGEVIYVDAGYNIMGMG